ncbi:MAG: hypothetical protein ACRD8K_09565 [Nitrososphaeraceae archaeon]|jgi:hypothetical protein
MKIIIIMMIIIQSIIMAKDSNLQLPLSSTSSSSLNISPLKDE